MVRDVKGITTYLKQLDEDKVENLLRLSGPIFRACSNLEFFNVSETITTLVSPLPESTPLGQSTPDNRSLAPFLTLKKAERYFLKFIALVTTGDIPPQESVYPLSRVRAVTRLFTYSVCVPLMEILSPSLDIEELETGSDAFEIYIDHTVKGD